eukprot:TRINITY_DN6171_c0_g1_i1.p1 TRINITY_DN6171_c0_g1~~TRINITY_DN6171_c0_g1_i1.p1  ORF type:complete len:563 (+),score=70.87 TRINITY_DN6171_c0_g1_i1:40-1728(+)
MPLGQWGLERAGLHPAWMGLLHDRQGQQLLARRYVAIDKPWDRVSLTAAERVQREKQLKRDWEAMQRLPSLAMGGKSYTAMVTALSQRGDFARARKVLEEMQREGMVPSAETYGVLVSQMLKRRRIQEAQEMFRSMPPQLRDTATYNALLQAHLVGDISATAFDELLAGFDPRPCPNHKTFAIAFRYGCRTVADMQRVAAAATQHPAIQLRNNLIVAQLNGIARWFRRSQNTDAPDSSRGSAAPERSPHVVPEDVAVDTAGGQDGRQEEDIAAPPIDIDAALAYAEEVYAHADKNDPNPPVFPWVANALLEVFRNAGRFGKVSALYATLPQNEVACTLYLSACASEVRRLLGEGAGGEAQALVLLRGARKEFEAAVTVQPSRDDFLWTAMMRVYAAFPPPRFKIPALKLFERFLRSDGPDSRAVRRFLAQACGGQLPRSVPPLRPLPVHVRTRRREEQRRLHGHAAQAAPSPVQGPPAKAVPHRPRGSSSEDVARMGPPAKAVPHRRGGSSEDVARMGPPAKAVPHRRGGSSEDVARMGPPAKAVPHRPRFSEDFARMLRVL